MPLTTDTFAGAIRGLSWWDCSIGLSGAVEVLQVFRKSDNFKVWITGGRCTS